MMNVNPDNPTNPQKPDATVFGSEIESSAERKTPKKTAKKPSTGSGQQRRLPTTKPGRKKPPARRPTPKPISPLAQWIMDIGRKPSAEIPSDFDPANPTEQVDAPRFKKTVRRNSTSVISSFTVHLVIIIALALWVMSWRKPVDTIDITVSLEPAPVVDVSPLDSNNQADIVVDQTDYQNEIDKIQDSIDVADQDIAAERSEQQDADMPHPMLQNIAPIPVNPTNFTTPTGGGLEGRSKAMRSALAGRRGGSRQSEAAVEAGLKWLIAHQFENGAWRFSHHKSKKCNGRCRNPGTHGSTTAATGLALMSFFGAGYTSKTGPYQTEINRGLDYLISRVRETKYGGNLTEGTMYAQGIATIALCEAYSMTRDQKLKKPATLAVQYIVNAQAKNGGWRYTPGQAGDITVTTWQIMALKSAEMAGIQVPRKTWREAKKFLDSVQNQSGYFGYISAEDQNRSCTAIGMLARMYTGWHREHEMFNPGHDILHKKGPMKTDAYFNYYATQVMFHFNDPKTWPAWNKKMRDYLVKTQSKTGHQAGSWYFKDKHGDSGGRLYNTCMSIMTLEVYYRFMPLYDSARFQE